MTTTSFDLLSTSAYGGCSAKLSPSALSDLLAAIPLIKDARILVDIETHDDAGVYKLNDDTALIVTTDFFPPWFVRVKAQEFVFINGKSGSGNQPLSNPCMENLFQIMVI